MAIASILFCGKGPIAPATIRPMVNHPKAEQIARDLCRYAATPSLDLDQARADYALLASVNWTATRSRWQRFRAWVRDFVDAVAG